MQESYGYFSEDGCQFIITRPEPLKPWINYLLTNGRDGALISQIGGRYFLLLPSQGGRYAKLLLG